jgi:hypothetical protein
MENDGVFLGYDLNAVNLLTFTDAAGTDQAPPDRAASLEASLSKIAGTNSENPRVTLKERAAVARGPNAEAGQHLLESRHVRSRARLNIGICQRFPPRIAREKERKRLRKAQVSVVRKIAFDSVSAHIARAMAKTPNIS